MRLFLKKDVQEFVIKTLTKSSESSFLKLNFFTDIFQRFDHNYYKNSLKYSLKQQNTFFP